MSVAVAVVALVDDELIDVAAAAVDRHNKLDVVVETMMSLMPTNPMN